MPTSSPSRYPGIDEGVTSDTDYTDGSGTWTFQSGIETILKGDDLNFMRQRFGFCSILMAIVQLVYIITMMSLCGLAPLDVNPAIGPYPDALSGCGAKNIYSICYDRQYWRFFTAPLMSIGVIHLICNTFLMLETGALFEREWGSLKWIIILTCSGVGSTIFSSIFAPDAVTVASSGAIMGLFGAKFSQLLLGIYHFDENEENVDVDQLGNISCSFIFTLMLAVFPFIDVSGHVGGLVTGFLIGMVILSRSIRTETSTKLMWVGVGIVLTIITSVQGIIIMVGTEIDANLQYPCYYFENMHVENYECACS